MFLLGEEGVCNVSVRGGGGQCFCWGRRMAMFLLGEEDDKVYKKRG